MSILFSQKLLKNNEIAPQEAVFTEVLSTIAVTPKKLYFYGKMPENRLKFGRKTRSERPKVLAVVGTRKPTKYGEKIAFELAFEAAKRGAVVVSGMAFGIDGIAHRGALEAGGRTVAVLGTPIDQVYPRAHWGLAEKIIETGGAVMSELAPGMKFYPRTSFLERNRLISGLADVVVVVEAAERSGSLNTAAHALDQGREVFAVPGDIGRPMSKGCNRLIQQGANVYTGAEDVLEVLFPQPRKAPKVVKLTQIRGETPEETRVLLLIFDGYSDGAEIMRKAALTAAECSQILTLLEIKGRIKALGMNQWALK